MNFNKLFIGLVLLLSFCASNSLFSQIGGRKKEHRNQRGGGSLFKRSKSSGHADAFAKGGGKKGFFSKLFHGKKSGGAWVYKKTRPGIKQNKEQPRLFTRNRTKAKRYRDGVLAGQNKKRTMERGSRTSGGIKRKR